MKIENKYKINENILILSIIHIFILEAAFLTPEALLHFLEVL